MRETPNPKSQTPRLKIPRLRQLVMLPAEWREWQYRHVEALGQACGTGAASAEQTAQARAVAEAWLERQPLASCLDEFCNPDVEPVIAK